MENNWGCAVVVYHERLDSWTPGSHTGTFRGNQLAFASGCAFIDVVERDGVLANVRTRGRHAGARLAELQRRYDGFISEVRTLGLMAGVEFSRPDGTPWPEAAAIVQREAFQRGLILEVGGRGNGVVRMLPPLNIDAVTLEVALAVFEQAVEAAGAVLTAEAATA